MAGVRQRIPRQRFELGENFASGWTAEARFPRILRRTQTARLPAMGAAFAVSTAWRVGAGWGRRLICPFRRWRLNQTSPLSALRATFPRPGGQPRLKTLAPKYGVSPQNRAAQSPPPVAPTKWGRCRGATEGAGEVSSQRREGQVLCGFFARHLLRACKTSAISSANSRADNSASSGELPAAPTSTNSEPVVACWL